MGEFYLHMVNCIRFLVEWNILFLDVYDIIHVSLHHIETVFQKQDTTLATMPTALVCDREH